MSFTARGTVSDDPQPQTSREETSDVRAYSEQLGRKAKEASRHLAQVRGAVKDAALRRAAQQLRARQAEILQANQEDLARGAELGLTAAQIDRLQLNPKRIESMAVGLEAVATLPDPVGQIIEGGVRPNGLEVRKVRVPLGVIFFIYESRPNVTADAAALALKSGNAIILRGGKEALASNTAIFRILSETFREVGIPEHAVQLVDRPERTVVTELLHLPQYIDLVIPRGGEGLIRTVAEEAQMPVLKHYKGNCHVYVDASADLAMAERIIVNAKCQRPGVCNAAESLLVHQAAAEPFLPRIAHALEQRGVELRGCPRTRQYLPHIRAATEEDFAAEYLDLIISVAVVDDIEAAIAHINRFGSGHTDAIVTRDVTAAQRFINGVDSAAVMVNTSTRFHDGYEFGLGAEIGISTDKFHARGPCGLTELTTYKWVVWGEGQVRE
ncbi:MAG: glutamate-5-semialdehyde dehydrogenase [Gemmatales bacterium]|nr:glutamate-5-semialdehyde dehydrogenase [Gemmatales bacterium]